jgi:hypothetical protein
VVGSCLWSQKPQAMDLACRNRDEWNWHDSAKENRKIQVKLKCGKSGNVLRKGARVLPCEESIPDGDTQAITTTQRSPMRIEANCTCPNIDLQRRHCHHRRSGAWHVLREPRAA